MSELKPCPLCGQEIYSEFYSNRAEEFDGHCTNKKCLLYGKDLLFFNTAKWNTRPIEDQLRSENEKLKATLREIANSAGEDALGYTTGEGHVDCIWKARKALEVTK